MQIQKYYNTLLFNSFTPATAQAQARDRVRGWDPIYQFTNIPKMIALDKEKMYISYMLKEAKHIIPIPLAWLAKLEDKFDDSSISLIFKALAVKNVTSSGNWYILIQKSKLEEISVAYS